MAQRYRGASELGEPRVLIPSITIGCNFGFVVPDNLAASHRYGKYPVFGGYQLEAKQDGSRSLSL